jgi:hypothetical protein
LTTTFAPRAANPRACARPKPVPAPVTIAVLPSNRMPVITNNPFEIVGCALAHTQWSVAGYANSLTGQFIRIIAPRMTPRLLKP